ncbi:MAG: LbtU family siderophore porin [Desulfobulbaceae bacterium]|nr:LbtU family siderophore porin [Desulfobulbaceae bacterium]
MRKSLPKHLLSAALVALTATSAWAEVAGDSEGGLLQAINDHVDLSALVEVEASSAKAFDKSKSSDIALATVEIGLDGQVSEWSSAHILLKYEEGEDNDHVFIDEGTITLGNIEKFPFMLTAGKMYVPFGAYNSNMISDPLTLEFGETNDSAVQILTAINGFYATAYVFNGKTDETDKDDLVRTYGANMGYTMSSDAFSLDAGIDWLSNLADSNGLADHISTTSGTIADPVNGLSFHATVEAGGFTVTGEYVAALDNFAAGEVDFKGQGAEPKAYNLEAAYGMEIANRTTTFALGYQATDEALGLGLPESRYIGAVSVELFTNTALALEYFYDEDYDTSDGGTGEDANTLTMQLALEF